jgi:hypothetical protein
MATVIRLRPLPKEEAVWRENAAQLHAYLRAAELDKVSYPNGNSGWEAFGPRSVREVVAEYATQYGYVLDWRPGNPHTCSVATLTKS